MRYANHLLMYISLHHKNLEMKFIIAEFLQKKKTSFLKFAMVQLPRKKSEVEGGREWVELTELILLSLKSKIFYIFISPTIQSPLYRTNRINKHVPLSLPFSLSLSLLDALVSVLSRQWLCCNSQPGERYAENNTLDVWEGIGGIFLCKNKRKNVRDE